VQKPVTRQTEEAETHPSTEPTNSAPQLLPPSLGKNIFISNIHRTTILKHTTKWFDEFHRYILFTNKDLLKL
jgi:hypothetical protein